MSKLTKREKQIMKSMNLDIHTTKSISEIGRICGTHKYDVWVGKEVSKDDTLINRLQDFQFIIDWAKKERPDIFSLSFEKAFTYAEEWHKNFNFEDSKIKKIKNSKNEERIIYISKNKKYFFIILNANELEEEGNNMKHCVASYGGKVLKNSSIIISMRDMQDQPHITIEVDIKTSSVVQVRGKANSSPSKEYLKIITEFAIYASGFEEEFDEEILNLINIKF